MNKKDLENMFDVELVNVNVSDLNNIQSYMFFNGLNHYSVKFRSKRKNKNRATTYVFESMYKVFNLSEFEVKSYIFEIKV